MIGKWKNKLFIFLFALTLIIAPAFYNPVLANTAGDTVTLTLLSINDFHGSLEANAAQKQPGAAKLAAFLAQEKAKNPTGTLLLSAGDMFQGSLDSNLLYGKPVIDVMNEMGFDAMALGNHEFDWGIDHLLQLKKAAHFPLGSANITLNGEVPHFARPNPRVAAPYIILTRDQVKIGIIPLTTPETLFKTNPRVVGAYQFNDPSLTVKQLLPQLQAAGADMVIVLSHLGSIQDRSTGQISGEAASLASSLPPGSLAALISGHTHLTVNGTINQIPIIQAAAYGKKVGEINITYSKSERKVISTHSTVFDINQLSISPDPNTQTIVDRDLTQLEPIKNTKVGSAAADFPHNRFDGQISLLGAWITDVMRNAVQADFAFQNGGGIRMGLTAGTITEGNLYQILPFDNTLNTMELTGAQIKEILEHGIRNPAIGMLQFSGATVTYDSSLPTGSRVTAVTLSDGTSLDLEKTYKVATNDFMVSGGDGYQTFLQGKNQQETGLNIRDLLAEDLQKIKTLTIADDHRLVILP